MKFELWKCPDPECGYIAITPEDAPKCRDCGKPMIVMADKEERAEADKTFKAMFRGVMGR